MTQRTTDGRAGGDQAETSEDTVTRRSAYSRGVRTLPAAAAEMPEIDQQSTSDDTIPGYRRTERQAPLSDRSMGLPVESIRRLMGLYPGIRIGLHRTAQSRRPSKNK